MMWKIVISEFVKNAAFVMGVLWAVGGAGWATYSASVYLLGEGAMAALLCVSVFASVAFGAGMALDAWWRERAKKPRMYR